MIITCDYKKANMWCVSIAANLLEKKKVDVPLWYVVYS